MATYGLSSAEAARRLEQRGPAEPVAGALTYRAIVRRNVLTLFNFVLAACAVALIATGQVADLLFAAVLVINSGIGIVQEIRAKRALDRLALLAAPARASCATTASARSASTTSWWAMRS